MSHKRQDLTELNLALQHFQLRLSLDSSSITMLFLKLILLSLLIAASGLLVSGETRITCYDDFQHRCRKIVACEGNTAVLTCGFRRIRIIRANYGRTDSTTCSSGRPRRQLYNTNCYSYSTLFNVVVRCRGKRSCQVPATNSVFSDPCFGTYKYLKVVYICV
ncbi:hypothetical protein AMELA_G00286990 [Ameiurus melas]|uniref:SUEL-type lectin domain-containing protein n=1 Tax=Ameiurus melas TaxID=219545 RepID=A0A7J5ZKX7_AMEME|nr:hypothetical protein AMELA_G00286990 [Ameiurus melas]